MWARCDRVEAYSGDDAGVGQGRRGGDDGVRDVVVDCLAKSPN